MSAQDAGKGLGRIVVAVLEIVCELLERQALRRVDAGTLTDEQIENLGLALISLQRQFKALREALGEPDTSNVRLPVDIADLLPQERTSS